MPITPFQREVLLLLAQNRNPESYVAGATVLHRAADSPRYSNDIDLFHDPAVSVQQCAALDLQLLRDRDYQVEVLLETQGFVRAIVRRSAGAVRLEWATDTAFRFFPIVADADLGFRLHEIDAAVNKCLALASRTEARDVIDLLTIHDRLLSVGACAWAACGKDPGFTPDLILEMLSRNARISPDLLAAENLREKVDAKAIKVRWIEVLADARTLVSKLNPEHLGCLFLDAKGQVPRVPLSEKYPHFGSVRGAWPKSEPIR